MARAHVMAMAAIDGVDVVVVDSNSLLDHVSLYEGLPRKKGKGYSMVGKRQLSWRNIIVPRLRMSDEEREEKGLPRVVVLVYNGSNHYDAAVPSA